MALAKRGAIKGVGTDWWAKNQVWNLMPMEDSKLLGLTGKEIHTLVHGKGFLKDGIRYDWNNIIGIGLKATYGTPTWFKTTINYSVSKVLNK